MLGMQLKIIVGREMHDFAKFVFGFVIFLRQDMIEHDQFFILVYVNSLFTWILECGLALDQGVLAL